MKLFVHAFLTEANKKFLREKLPREATVLFLDEIAESARRAEFAGCTYVYGNPPPEWLREEARNIKWIQLYSAGFSEYQQLGKQIPVSNMHGFFASPCAETVVGGILALYRKIDELTLLKSRKEWIGIDMRPGMKLLSGKRTLLLGAGTIAVRIEELLKGFFCDVKYYSRKSPRAIAHTREELFEAIPSADIVINTLPGTAETYQFVSASFLEAMHKEAIFVNIGRGSTVDQAALIQVLLEERIGGAVLDVCEEEPLPPDSPLWTCPNTILSQHTGGGFDREQSEKVGIFIGNLYRVLEGGTPDNLVDLERGY
ncbi:phosphoglycerate dehydrogenase-like enzyme [Anseongella ginsenosidimutans]|uniref:Phosphoglycerate dehydrogenase-like enzyme n=1 Tax=Anseongella ginsenosidimutans TaxID=496056 RepID=A0A4R3KPU2_9SPHI|nr:D-2-hydroxyacid dehydrogenase [Anseongella ginsenosidimutans]QEC52356.1 D-2-hydroxyacid dehydrogenase [Anseongella ginsenosidimutans]TCS85902.1 phosphoglycerate dehydrogenase-like enzyme [Anseongella ginsenosidimutans]